MNWPNATPFACRGWWTRCWISLRVEAGRVQAVYRQTDLAAFTADIASGFRSACEKAGLSLTIRASPLSGPVFVDREMWEKIVLNLVSNAFKFTLEGGSDISLANEDARAVLSVRDTGVGIPEGEMARLFERFHRVEGTRGRTHEGTGIYSSLWCGNWSTSTRARSRSTAVWDKGRLFPFDWHSARVICARTGLRPKAARAPTAIRADAFVAEALRWLPDGFEPLGICKRRQGDHASGDFASGGFRQRGFRQGDHARGITPGGMPNRGT